jgi:hypothetical protein
VTAVRWYRHNESGAVHGFSPPIHKEIVKQITSGELVRITDPSSGMDPDEKIAQLEARIAKLVELSGIDPSALEADGLADTSVPGAEAEPEPDAEDDGFPEPDDEPDDDGQDDSVQGLHLCESCGDPVERNGKTGPWPKKHKGCR